jgi:hypothetical protein
MKQTHQNKYKYHNETIHNNNINVLPKFMSHSNNNITMFDVIN